MRGAEAGICLIQAELIVKTEHPWNLAAWAQQRRDFFGFKQKQRRELELLFGPRQAHLVPGRLAGSISSWQEEKRLRLRSQTADQYKVGRE
jgi:hypothetical protein